MSSLETDASYELPLHLGTADLPAANVNGLSFEVVIEDESVASAMEL